MNFLEDFSNLVSTGERIHDPARLQDRSTGWVLSSIVSGRWTEPVANVRTCGRSGDRLRLKRNLPYFTPSGLFERRCNDGLLMHAGQMAVDVDGLDAKSCLRVISKAVIDPYCMAAFHTASGTGVRLMYRVPPLTPTQHPIVFREVAEHVRNAYGVAPDLSCADVSRASFVSHDQGLWVNPAAEVFPITPPLDPPQRYTAVHPLCTISPSRLWLQHLGNSASAYAVKPDGTALTHGSLLDLGKAIALRAERERIAIREEHLQQAFDGWLRETFRRGLRLRGDAREYFAELRDNVRAARGRPWFNRAANKWLRWRTAPGFPRRGSAVQKILFAIRQHCAETRTSEFFLSCRDAADVAGISAISASRVLRALVKSGRLERIELGKRPARHAQEYRLLKQ